MSSDDHDTQELSDHPTAAEPPQSGVIIRPVEALDQSARSARKERSAFLPIAAGISVLSWLILTLVIAGFTSDKFGDSAVLAGVIVTLAILDVYVTVSAKRNRTPDEAQSAIPVAESHVSERHQNNFVTQFHAPKPPRAKKAKAKPAEPETVPQQQHNPINMKIRLLVHRSRKYMYTRWAVAAVLLVLGFILTDTRLMFNIVLPLLAAFAIGVWVDWASYFFAITDKELILSRRYPAWLWFLPTGLEFMPLTRVGDYKARQKFWQRILGVGDFDADSSAQEDKAFNDVSELDDAQYVAGEVRAAVNSLGEQAT